MTIAEIMKRMIAYSQGNLHDISHLIKVWGYAKTIGELERLDEKTQFLLEAAAIVHDIACPLCREKYGSTSGQLQEREGMPLTAEFLKDAGLGEKELERVIYLVGHHHTLTNVDGLDHQILLEADFLVNAEESGYPVNAVKQFCRDYFKTSSGTALLDSVFCS